MSAAKKSAIRQYIYNPAKCPWTATWNVIGQKRKGIIWWRLSVGIGRFGELQRAIPQVSRKVLTQQLREMERDGIISRRVIRQPPSPRGNRSISGRGVTVVEYELTDHGRSMAPAIEAVCRWGASHLVYKSSAGGPN